MQPKKFDRANYHPHDFLCGKHKHENRWRHNNTHGFSTDSCSLDNLFFNSYQPELCVSDVMLLTEWEMVEYMHFMIKDHHAKGSKYLRMY